MRVREALLHLLILLRVIVETRIPLELILQRLDALREEIVAKCQAIHFLDELATFTLGDLRRSLQ